MDSKASPTAKPATSSSSTPPKGSSAASPAPTPPEPYRMPPEAAAELRAKAAAEPHRWLTPEEVEDLRAEMRAAGEQALAHFRAQKAEREKAQPSPAPHPERQSRSGTPAPEPTPETT